MAIYGRSRAWSMRPPVAQAQGPVWRGNEPGGLSLITDHPMNSTPFGGWGSAGLTIESDATAPRSPPNIGQILYPANFGGGDSPGSTGYDSSGAGATTLYLGFYCKFSSNWQGHPTGTNKVFHVWINGANRCYIPAMGSGAGPLDPEIGLQAVTVAGSKSTLKAVTIQRGHWHLWEVVLVANTNGVADGSADLYFDGDHVESTTGIQWVASGASRVWESINWDPTWGGLGGTVSADMTMQMDEIYASGKP